MGVCVSVWGRKCCCCCINVPAEVHPIGGGGRREEGPIYMCVGVGGVFGCVHICVLCVCVDESEWVGVADTSVVACVKEREKKQPVSGFSGFFVCKFDCLFGMCMLESLCDCVCEGVCAYMRIMCMCGW